MRSNAVNRAADTSAKKARRLTAKRSATMRTTRMSRRGSSPASARRRSCTRSRSISRKCIRRREVTSETKNTKDTKDTKDKKDKKDFKIGRYKPGALMRLHLRIWRQAGPDAAGRLVDYVADRVSPDMSFLEVLDVVNEALIKKGEDAIAFDSDCREGICGMCSLVVNGVPHGPDRGTTVCQLHMRRFKDGDTITIEPWRARAFPIVKDLVVDRSAFDRIIAAGGYVSANCGGAPDGNTVLIPKET